MQNRFSLILAAAIFLPACSLFSSSKPLVTHSITSNYPGLADKSTAIIIYPRVGITDEYPSAREEISAFISTQMRLHLANTPLLNYKRVTNWQDDTINWYGLPEKEIGKHFSVDRVLYVELLEYTARADRGQLQGHIKARCKIFETDAPGTAPAWAGIIDVAWPGGKPLDPIQISEDTVRQRTLEIFAQQLVDCFHKPESGT